METRARTVQSLARIDAVADAGAASRLVLSASAHGFSRGSLRQTIHGARIFFQERRTDGRAYRERKNDLVGSARAVHPGANCRPCRRPGASGDAAVTSR